MSRNNIQHDTKIKVLITIIIALLFPNWRLVLCQIFSYDFPNIRNLIKIFLRSFKNVAPDACIHGLTAPLVQATSARYYI